MTKMTKITKYTAVIVGPKVCFSRPTYVGDTLHAAKCNASRILGDDFPGHVIKIYAYDNVTPSAEKTTDANRWYTNKNINPPKNKGQNNHG